jgi:hypothetical protein
MCEHCNPLGLKEPAASQAHGTVFVGIAVAVVLMAVFARVAVSGVGPFTGALSSVVADPAGLKVTVVVRNEGTSEGATTCRIGDPDIRGIGPETAYVSSPIIAPGQSATFDAVVTTLGTEVRPLTISCGT